MKNMIFKIGISVNGLNLYPRCIRRLELQHPHPFKNAFLSSIFDYN